MGQRLGYACKDVRFVIGCHGSSDLISSLYVFTMSVTNFCRFVSFLLKLVFI